MLVLSVSVSTIYFAIINEVKSSALRDYFIFHVTILILRGIKIKKLNKIRHADNSDAVAP